MNTFPLKRIDYWLGGFLIGIVPSSPTTTWKTPEKTPRFLFIRPGGIGDAVLLIPAIHQIKAVYPKAHIEILAESRNSAIFTLCSAVSRIHRYDNIVEFSTCLRQHYDCVIDTEQYHRLSAVTARFIRSTFTVGFAGNGRDKMYSECVYYSHNDYEVDSFYRLLTPIGVVPPHKTPTPYLFPSEAARQTSLNLLAPVSQQPFITLFPGASINERRWGAENFCNLTQVLNKSGFQIVVIGGKEDREAGETIIRGNRGINLAGQTTLAESAAVIERSCLLVCGDSGMLHICVGLDIASVSLFGPGIAHKWAPRSDKHIIVNKGLPCSPCTEFGYTPKCPDNAACIRQITVEEVFTTALKHLNCQAQTRQ